MKEINSICATLKELLELEDRILPSKKEKTLIKSGRLDEVIYDRITSTKFRKSQILPSTAEFTKGYIHRTVKEKSPIRLYFTFGGYKQSRLSSAPYPEWAEIFNINFALKTAGYVESIYSPGVEIIYRGDEVIMTYLCNYKVVDRKAYGTMFNQMIDVFKKRIPENRKITIRYELTSETSPEDKLVNFMEKVFDKYLIKFAELNEEEQKKKILISYRNQCWNGEEDLTKLSKAEKTKRAKWAFIMHGAFLEADITMAKDYFDNGISISYRRGVPGCLHYGSCSSCSVQFWAGEGFLNHLKERYISWILSYDQQQGVSINYVPVSIQDFNKLGLNKIGLLKNFS